MQCDNKGVLVSYGRMEYVYGQALTKGTCLIWHGSSVRMAKQMPSEQHTRVWIPIFVIYKILCSNVCGDMKVKIKNTLS